MSSRKYVFQVLEAPRVYTSVYYLLSKTSQILLSHQPKLPVTQQYPQIFIANPGFTSMLYLHDST